MKDTIFIILLFFSLLGYNQINEDVQFSNEEKKIIKKFKVKRNFEINKIVKTTRFYILNARDVLTDELILLVINKKSKQLKRVKKITVGSEYCFKTYSFFNVTNPNGTFCHSVDGKEIWCEKDNIDLRFTDDMGNDILPDSFENAIEQFENKDK